MKEDAVNLKSLDDAKLRLLQQKDACSKAMMDMVSGENQGIFFLDLLFVAALNRASSQLDALIDLLQKRNYIVAASLLRLQLDSCLRLYGSTLVVDSQAYAKQIWNGEKVTKIKSKSGDLLTDTFLRQALAKEFDWVDRVYERSSGFIHLSAAHIFSSVHAGDSDKNSIKIIVGAKQEHIPEELFIELASAFVHVTEVLFWLANEWSHTKHAKKDKNK